jgi:hypothetical protein
MSAPAPTSGANIRNFSCVAYANGFTLWHYKATRNSLAEVTAPGFFDPMAELISAGDVVMISAADGGRVAFIQSDETPITLGAAF